jgi:transposase
MAAKVVLREISNEEGNRLLRIVRRTSGSVVTWRRAQIVLLAAQGQTPARISEVVFTDPDTVRELIHNFNRDGFEALYPRYRGGRPPTFTLPQRRQIKQIALCDPLDLDLPFATWSLAKLADYLVTEGVVTDISHEGLRQLLAAEGVRFQAVRTWKRSNDPEFAAKRDRILALYAAAARGEALVICLDEFGPLNLQPQPGGKASGAARQAQAYARHLHPPPWRASSAGRLRSLARPPLQAHQDPQGPGRVPRLPPLRALAPSARGALGLRARQLQPPRRRNGARLGGGQQRRACLHALLRLLAEPHRGAVPRPALLHSGGHRPPRSRHPGAPHPALHRLAQPSYQRPPSGSSRHHGERCLMLH